MPEVFSAHDYYAGDWDAKDEPEALKPGEMRAAFEYICRKVNSQRPSRRKYTIRIPKHLERGAMALMS